MARSITGKVRSTPPLCMLMFHSLIDIDSVVLVTDQHLLARDALIRRCRWLGVGGFDAHWGGIV